MFSDFISMTLTHGIIINYILTKMTVNDLLLKKGKFSVFFLASDSMKLVFQLAVSCHVNVENRSGLTG